jgi:hypothetical protein
MTDHKEPDSPSLADDLGYLPTGIRVMLLDPLPTHLGQGSRTILAFAAVGAEDLLRQRRNETLVSPSPPS